MLLCDEDLKEFTALNEQEYQENSDTAVERPQLTNNALKKGLQTVDDVITSSRLTISDIHASNLSTRRRMSWHPYKEVCKNIWKENQSEIISFFTKSSVSPFAMHFMLSDYPNIQPGTSTSLQ
jgi:hypothetical protein